MHRGHGSHGGGTGQERPARHSEKEMSHGSRT
jgi:hypothetical protein